jgi:hypothetical protein
MTVRREDLIAAADAGVLHYAEVDSLLIYLRQREMTAQKADPGREQSGWSRPHWKYYLSGMLAIGIVTLLGIWLISPAVSRLGVLAALSFTLIYALCAIGASAWFGLRGGRVAVGIFSVLLIALMPLAIVALQQMVVSAL